MDRARWISDTWAAIARGDLRPLSEALAPDAQWRAVYDGPWNCQNKSMILAAMTDRVANGLSGSVEEVIDHGDRSIVGFRPDHPDPEGWPLDKGVRYLVVSFTGDVVTELKGCIDRQTALSYDGQP